MIDPTKPGVIAYIRTSQPLWGTSMLHWEDPAITPCTTANATRDCSPAVAVSPGNRVLLVYRESQPSTIVVGAQNMWGVTIYKRNIHVDIAPRPVGNLVTSITSTVTTTLTARDIFPYLFYLDLQYKIWIASYDTDNKYFLDWKEFPGGKDLEGPPTAIRPLETVGTTCFAVNKTGGIETTRVSNTGTFTQLPKPDASVSTIQELGVEFYQTAYHIVYTSNNNRIYHVLFDGATWTLPEQITEATDADSAPTICIFQGRLLCAYRKKSTLYYHIYTGQRWTGPTQITKVSTAIGNPAAAVVDDTLYFFYTQPGPEARREPSRQ